MTSAVPRPLPVLLVLFALLAGLYSVVLPPYEAPDEIWHMAVVHHIVTHHDLPVSEPDTTALFRQQGVQAPGYYLATALLTGWVDQSDFPRLYAQDHPHAAIGGGPDPIKRAYFWHDPALESPWHGAILALHIARFFSIVLGVITLWAVYQTLVLLTNPQTALLGTALLAFIPQFVFISGAANNDNAINATAALAIWRLVVLLKEVPDPRQKPWDYALLGLFVGLALLSKLSGLWLIGVAVVAIGIVAYRAKSWRWLGQSVGITLCVTAVVSGWYLVRNYWLYRDPLASNIWFSNILLRRRPATWRTLVYSEWESLDHSFWGLFGWFNVAYPTWVYRGFQLVEVLIVIGLAIGLWRQWRQGSFRTAPFWQRTAVLLLVAWLVCLFVSWAAFFRLAPAAQGRYFYPAAATLALGMVWGLGAWRRRVTTPRYLAWGIVGVFFGLSAITPWWLIQPAYAPEPILAELPPTATPLNLTFGDEMQLIGYEITPTTVAPSKPTDLTLYWRTVRPMTETYSISIKAFGREQSHETLVEDNSYPDAGRWATPLWPTEGIVVDRWRLWMSGQTITPTLAKLTVEVFLFDRITGAPGMPLPITLDGTAIASPYHFGDIVVRDDVAPAPPADFVVRPVSPTVTITDSTATLNFVWEVGQPLPQDYQMLVHLVDDPAAPPLASGDTEPVEGNLPTSYWQAGDTIQEQATLDLPTTLAPADYDIYVGLYDLVTFERVVGEGDTSAWEIARVRWDGTRWSVVTP